VELIFALIGDAPALRPLREIQLLFLGLFVSGRQFGAGLRSRFF
jgi:hypothetical protein